ncbi:MAG: hypothetical protein HDS16_08105 [Bacteroides sp.]|nr:hypothetical protein [Bacteroides sp.]
MRNLVSKVLLVLITVFGLGLPIQAADYYVTGNANAMSTKDTGWTENPSALSTDASGDIYFWVKDEFAISTNRGSWDALNGSRFVIKYADGNYVADFGWKDNTVPSKEFITWQNGDKNSDGYWFVKLHHNGDQNVTVTVQNAPFTGHEGVFGQGTTEPTEPTNPSSKTYYLRGSFIGNWNHASEVKFTPVSADNDKVLSVTYRYNEASSNNLGFKITTSEPGKTNGDWYSNGQTLTPDTEYNMVGQTVEPNMRLHRSALTKDVTYTITLNDKYEILTLTATWDTEGEVIVSSDMPVYPIGVYNDEALLRYDSWPVLYLKGRVLNNERITPEYQMTQVSSDEYVLEFTARNTNTRDESYSEWDQAYQVVGFENAQSPIKTFVNEYKLDLGSQFGKKRPTEGARMKAICKKGSNGNWTLTLEQVDEDINVMPYISMMGGEWKQRVNAKTPYADYSMKNTDMGWQESWIQYDKRGQIALDRYGRVMYNTMWPPRNPILFKTEFELNGDKKDFTLTSKDLAMKFVATKSGKEWKEDPHFSEYISDHLDVNNRFEHEGKLALDDNRQYSLYQVEDMWINGKVKMWTGWGGVTRTDDNGAKDMAIWDTHSNWGHWTMCDNQHPATIQPGSSVPLAYKDGDMIFDKPTFFKYVNFFYDYDDPSAQGRSVLFTELAMGGAQIAAITTDYQWGNYQPALSMIDEYIKDGEIKSIEIRSYATNNDGDTPTEEMMAQVFKWNEGGVKPADFYTIFADLAGNEDLPGDGSFEDPASTAKWVKDPTDYKNGDYFYRMKVILTDNNGVSHEITVDSNPFTIFNTEEKLSLNVYQLVKVGDELIGDVRHGHYYTFRGTEEHPETPVLPAYELFIVNDDKFENPENQEWKFDENGNLISGYIDDSNYEFTFKSLDELPDYASNDLQFTDKILIVGSVPSANTVEGYKYEANPESGSVTPPDVQSEDAAAGRPAKAPDTEEWDRSAMRSDYDNRFIHVTNVGTFQQRKFELQMMYSTSFLNADGELVQLTNEKTAPVIANYFAVIPEPELDEAKFEVFYGTDLDESTDNDVREFEFRGHKFDARFHSVRDHISINFPNVSTFLKERMILKDFFSLQITDGDMNSDDSYEWGNVFEFTTEDDVDGVVHGRFIHPNQYEKARKFRLVRKEADEDGNKYVYYPRWQDGSINPLDVSENAPIRFAHTVVNPQVYVEEGHDDGRHLISEFTLRIQHDPEYTPSDEHDTYEGAMDDRHNYIFHQGKNDLFEHLHHHSDYDYYYITVVDETAHNAESDDYSDAIIDQTGNLANENSENVCEFVWPATAVLSNVRDQEDGTPLGYRDVTIKKDYGTIDVAGLNFSALVEEITTNHYAKNLKVLVSYLYPFNVDNPASDKPGLSRSAADQTGVVLKSKANIGAVNTDAVNIITGVDEVLNELPGYVKVGAGFIEVEGTGVQIINAAGVTVAEGEGHHDVTAGVYVVRYSGKTTKVVVR